MSYKLVIIAHNNVFVVHVFLTGARGNLHVSTLYWYILIIISIYSCNLMLNQCRKKAATRLRTTLLLFYYCLLLRKLFSYSVVWCGIVPEPTAKALYLTRQHYRKTVLETDIKTLSVTQHFNNCNVTINYQQ
jgi:hypothetical protein